MSINGCGDGHGVPVSVETARIVTNLPLPCLIKVTATTGGRNAGQSDGAARGSRFPGFRSRLMSVWIFFGRRSASAPAGFPYP